MPKKTYVYAGGKAVQVTKAMAKSEKNLIPLTPAPKTWLQKRMRDLVG